jgi:hypothetical protein
MASASLNNMSIPPSGAGSNQGLLMPKLKYRFRVFFDNLGAASTPTTELTKQVMSFTRPNLTFEEITLPIYNSTLKLAGKHTWADVTCEVRDDASGQVSKLVGQQMQKQMDFLEMASAASGIDYKFTTRVQILDGGNGAEAPVVLEEWALYGCYLKGADYGSLNYGESAPVTISLSIAYDNANQITGDVAKGGVGIGRILGQTVAGTVSGAGTTPATTAS